LDLNPFKFQDVSHILRSSGLPICLVDALLSLDLTTFSFSLSDRFSDGVNALLATGGVDEAACFVDGEHCFDADSFPSDPDLASLRVTTLTIEGLVTSSTASDTSTLGADAASCTLLDTCTDSNVVVLGIDVSDAVVVFGTAT
jgi:hypothetical protein